MTRKKAWLEALRLRTLPLSLSGILLGSLIAFAQGFTDYFIFILAMLTTVTFQILSNLANDLGDSLKGTDNEERVGPMRSVQSGIISVKEMKNAVIVTAMISLVLSIALIYFGTRNMPTQMIWFYGALAILCILAAITYTIGKRAYGYSGFGDLMVFVFFGIVSVLGVYSLYTKFFDILIVLPAAGIGLLSVAVLNLNNMRDIHNDAKSGKNTLVVKMGGNIAKMYHAFLILGSLTFLILFVYSSGKQMAYLGLLPGIILLIHLRAVMKISNPKEFDPHLKIVALSTFGIALITGLLLLI